MGKLVVTEFVTVDGVIDDPGGVEDFERGGWAFDYDRGDVGNQFKFNEILAAQVQLLGRVTYEVFAESWPSRESEFADRMNTMPKYVVSKSPRRGSWQNTTVLSGDVGGRELFTWCAWDTLFLPAMLDAPAEVRSSCPLTGTPVRLRVDAGGIAEAEPADLWVCFPPTATTSTADIVASFCCHVHFLAGQDTAQQWVSEHPGGRILTVRDAYDVGQRATAQLRTATAGAE